MYRRDLAQRYSNAPLLVIGRKVRNFLDLGMCDEECKAKIMANAESEIVEAENAVFLIVFFLLVTLVYITGLIVWVWCNRNPTDGLSAVPHTNVVAQRERILNGRNGLNPCPYSTYNSLHHKEVLLMLGALIGERQPKCHLHHQSDENMRSTANGDTARNTSNVRCHNESMILESNSPRRPPETTEVIIETRRVPHCTAAVFDGSWTPQQPTTTATSTTSQSSSTTSSTSMTTASGTAKTASIVLRPGSDLDKPEVVVHTIAEV